MQQSISLPSEKGFVFSWMAVTFMLVTLSNQFSYTSGFLLSRHPTQVSTQPRSTTIISSYYNYHKTPISTSLFATESNEDDNKNFKNVEELFPAFVIGYRGGIAEQITRNLGNLSGGKKVSAIFDASKLRSDAVVDQGVNVDVKYEDLYNFNTAPLSNKVISGDVKSIFVSLDNPLSDNSDNEMHDYRPLNDLLSNFIQTANNNPKFYEEVQKIPIVISSYGNDTASNAQGRGVSLFNSLLSGGNASPKEMLNAFRNIFPENIGNAILTQHGRLIGSLTGEEPMPFISAPLGEPVVEESWLRQTTLMSVGGAMSRGSYKEKTTQRSTVAKAMILAANRIIEGKKIGNKDIIKNFSVINLPGPPNSDKEIKKLVENLDVSRGIQLLEIDLKGKGLEIPTNKRSFIEYVVDDWGPNVLTSLKVSKRLDSAKPTRVYEAKQAINEGNDIDVIEIVWEQLVGDMEFEVIGKWRLQIGNSSMK